jgi:hypothetical protein
MLEAWISEREFAVWKRREEPIPEGLATRATGMMFPFDGEAERESPV